MAGSELGEECLITTSFVNNLNHKEAEIQKIFSSSDVKSQINCIDSFTHNTIRVEIGFKLPEQRIHIENEFKPF